MTPVAYMNKDPLTRTDWHERVFISFTYLSSVLPQQAHAAATT
ncbi:hypothetical protein N007_12330 [Alicyclobacillus acidoterrestris ATCC 49025]|nr:hypothetical protein N007_12330 [Alicyclobacillus acidoterrestris ATCC 49025]